MAQIPGADECSRCHAPILWAVTDRGKRMPVDYRPDPDGTVELTTDGTTRHATVLTGMLLDQAQPGTLHKSHFATCPYANEVRRRRPGDGR